MASGRICLGMIVGVHGVRGNLKIKSYTEDPAALDQYGPVSLEDGRHLHLKVKAVLGKGPLIVIAREVTDRNEADALRGLEVFITRDALPPAANDEVYHADLIGLEVRGSDGDAVGVILGFHNFGAGELVEVKPLSGPTIMLPFAPEYREKIRPEVGFVTLSPPPGMIDFAGLEGRADKLEPQLDAKLGRRKMQNIQNKGVLE